METPASEKSPLYKLGLVGAFVGMFAVPTGMAYLADKLAQEISRRQSIVVTVTEERAQPSIQQAGMPAQKKPEQKRADGNDRGILPINPTGPVPDKRFPARPNANQQKGLPIRKEKLVPRSTI